MDLKNKIVLLDFWAEWCHPCKMISPIVDEIKNEFKDKIKVYKINVEDDKGEGYELVNQFKVMSLPTILILDDEKVIHQFVGMQSKEKLSSLINAICDSKEKK